jgi:hypothetical protein
MAAILAAFANWSRNASLFLLQLPHQYRNPAFFWTSISFQGESGHFVGPTAGAHHLAIVYSPEAFDASDLTGAGGQSDQKSASGVTVTSNRYRRNLHTWGNTFYSVPDSAGSSSASFFPLK